MPHSEQGDRDGFEVTEEEKAFLLASLAQARRGEGIDGWQLLEEIRGRYAASERERL